MFFYLEKNFNPEWVLGFFFCYAANTKRSKNGFLHQFYPQITKNGRKCWTEDPRLIARDPICASLQQLPEGKRRCFGNELGMGDQPSCPKVGPQCCPPSPWVPPATTTICSLLRCKRGSPRHLERALLGPPCEICACLHYYYFNLETTNYFIFPDLHTNIKAEAIQTPYNLIILHYSAGNHF